MTENKSIICSNVPQGLLNRTAATQHFKTFGPTVKVIVKPKSKLIQVNYETLDGARMAFQHANKYRGEEFAIAYQIKVPKVKRKPSKDPDPDWELDPAVQEELLAMGNNTGPKRQYNLRPEKMVVDEFVNLKKAATKRNESKSKAKNQTVEKELLSILKQKTSNAEERYRVLEARDKLIRLNHNKTMDLHNAKTTVGCCPDMCSEKERLMRESQHQVAVYEQELGERTMNHSIAVKQYSRSSADQEMPLPHELRNVDVLKMTMGYLMHRIMNLSDTPDVNHAEWFHFLWDRMRGIRKDITQQELCCPGSVELVEQCARFHIHCSARLVAEDPSVFDQKINTENLTKCLQTLKYMYHDLAVKGIHCPREAEFRAYIILLNLNDGNFMWEVQQLQPHIQCSREIKFALEVYSSLDKNNFVRFFKLVRSTTYLNACLLLRYFIQVRTKALRTIVQCYTPRMLDALIPIDQLTKILAFEDRASAIDFLEHYGLSVNAEGDFAVVNRREFMLPDLPYTLERSVNVIESKRVHSVGETVCGAPLPPPLFQTHKVQNSFNADGYFDITEFQQFDETDHIADIVRSNERSCSPFMDTNSKEGFAASKPANVDSKPAGLAFTFSDPAIAAWQQQQHDILQQRLQQERQQLEATKQRQLQEQLQREREEHARLLLLQKQQEERLQAEMLRRQEEASRIEAERLYQLEQEERRLQQEKILAAQKQADLENERKRKLQQELEQKRRQLEQEEAKKREMKQIELEKRLLAEREAQETQILLDIQKSVRRCMDDMLNQVEEICTTSRLKELKNITLSRMVLQRWRSKVSSNRRKRKAIDQGPLWPTRLTTAQMAEQLFTTNQDMTLNMMKRYKRGLSIGFTGYEKYVIKKVDLAKLTANELIRNSMRTKQLQTEIYWKIGLHYCDSASMNNIINECIGWDQNRIFLKQVIQGQNKLTYCLHKCLLQDNDNNGLIIIVDKINDELLDDLSDFLNNLGDFVYMPIVFIVQEHEYTLEKQIDELCTFNKLISEYDIIDCPFTPEHLPAAISNGLNFLARFFRPPPNLHLNTLRDFLMEHLISDLWPRIRSFTRWNMPYKQILDKPNIAIALFNEALDKLKSIVLNPQRCEHATFPNIFRDFLPNQIPDFLPCDFKYFPVFWKENKYNKQLEETFSMLKLPYYNGTWPIPGNERLPCFEQELLEYCSQIYDMPDKIYLEILARLFRGASRQWLDVMEVLTQKKLELSNFQLDASYKGRTIFNQLIVVYQQQDIQSYQSEAWFYMKNPLIEKELSNIEEPPSESHRQDNTVESNDEINDDVNLRIDLAVKHLTDQSKEAENTEKCKTLLDDFQYLMNDLEASMSIQRQVSEKFQHNLKLLLDDV